ncbi:Clp protease proteolytic subunit [Tanacetum coccineum]
MSPENKDHYESEKEAIHLILTGIGDEIYLTVDACKTAHEMWEAIKRLQQGESLNIQDVKTNLFWEFGKFTSHDGETIESYYTRFYKLMNEMIRNNLTVDKMQVNVQFLQQLQPESLNLFLVCHYRLCHLVILCLDQHAHTMHHLESLLTIYLDNLCLDNLDIFKEDLEYQSLRYIEDDTKDLYLFINSPGGWVIPGVALYDTMQFVQPDVHTICMGSAASMGSFILEGWVMIHQPAGSFSEVATGEFILEVGELLKLRETLTRVYVQRTGKPLWVVSEDMERDVFMSATEAQAYGIVDLVAVE